MMKNKLCLISLLLLALLVSCSEVNPQVNDAQYKRVIIVGVDGAGHWFEDANTPNFDAIIASDNCAYGYNNTSEYPSTSAQNWGSYLHGVSPEKHNCNNTSISASRYLNREYPSIFKLIRNAYPDAKLASLCHWNPINYGLIEDRINVYKDPDIRFCGEIYSDEEVKDNVIEYLDNNDPKLLFVHLDGPDEAGHGNGYGSDLHKKAIEDADKIVGEIYDKVVEKYTDFSETLFIVVTDHGGSGHGHGGNSDDERQITMAIKGNTVIKQEINSLMPKDVAVIVLEALGVSIPNNMEGEVPAGLFIEANN